ncbi:putative trypanothione synthetase [Trypanosoma conorhini]|uniref:Putative trypanothione synthetase n=1 Tax=Trypanosoma conorhini TaxID=83891 RepID=A0A3R7LHZ4_9TRYP|nr:putative trypanothione synthetase [Trypanosoma conorhini]RNF27629.1 putative trypanothione synthetase [Trypanosoma conorhini]
MPSGAPVPVERETYGEATQLPSVGDLLIWSRTEELPYGPLAAVTRVSEKWVCVAEQNYEFRCWQRGKNYSRRFACGRSEAGVTECFGESHLLGWITVQAPPYDFSFGDLPDK